MLLVLSSPLILLMTVGAWDRIVIVVNAITSSTIGFLLSIIIVAITMWGLRTYVESDPDPFFLNLTFFAFAGVVIKVVDLFFRDGKINGRVGFLLLLATAVVLAQVSTLRQHMAKTLDHYNNLLRQFKKDRCTNEEIGEWASRLLLITGVDFSPRHGGLAAEPRKRSREKGFWILPANRFKVGDFDSESLLVPPDKRKPLWRRYVALCLVSWIVFVIALVISGAKS